MNTSKSLSWYGATKLWPSAYRPNTNGSRSSAPMYRYVASQRNFTRACR